MQLSCFLMYYWAQFKMPILIFKNLNGLRWGYLFFYVCFWSLKSSESLLHYLEPIKWTKVGYYQNIFGYGTVSFEWFTWQYSWGLFSSKALYALHITSDSIKKQKKHGCKFMLFVLRAYVWFTLLLYNRI